MVLRWFPWRTIVRRLARAHGFIDPMSVLSRVESFAQPSEVSTPIELLRAGVVFHARGLMNTKVIQHNLDWVWPYWVQRQFDPADPAFLPRAFSITHVNLTHRNWTAVGFPGCRAYPIVDPRGLVTPFFDGWSLDAWLLFEEGADVIPSSSKHAAQRLLFDEGGPTVETEARGDGGRLRSRVSAALEQERPVCTVRCRAQSRRPAWLALALRPCNPEGVSFIRNVQLQKDRRTWRVNDASCIELGASPDRHLCSDYRRSDVHHNWTERKESLACECDVGMATAAALYRLEPDAPRETTLRVDLSQDADSEPAIPAPVMVRPWAEALRGAAGLAIPDRQVSFLYEAALRTLILHSPHEVYPGPYTYKRFWFRDAAFILHAMLCAGITGRVRHVLDRFPGRQKIDGFFESQAGEWDSNGEALWILNRYAELTGDAPRDWKSAAVSGARWIARKRLDDDGDALHAGLLPAGFSAEHLGNNDYYYWDDFWGVAGLRAAAALCGRWDEARHAKRFEAEAEAFMGAIERSLRRSESVRRHPGLPAAPGRRMDTGAVGSLVAGYPLQLLDEEHAGLAATADFLFRNSLMHGAFFQDMIHSGMNAYLTLHLAQVLLRAGDGRALPLMRNVARLASPTGQWPEAIHPHTGGGCMGDGQHVWAAAEWVMMVRNCFVREEPDRLVLGSGIAPGWLQGADGIRFGPTPTRWGPVTVTVEAEGDAARVSWEADWRGAKPRIEVRLPGRTGQIVKDDECAPVTIPGAAANMETRTPE